MGELREYKVDGQTFQLTAEHAARVGGVLVEPAAPAPSPTSDDDGDGDGTRRADANRKARVPDNKARTPRDK